MIQYILRSIGDFDFIYFTLKEKENLRKYYNTSYSPKSYYIDKENELIFLIFRNEGFGSWEYYYGMEYEKEYIRVKIQYEDDLLIGYDMECERLIGILTRVNEDLENIFCEQKLERGK